MVYNWLARKSCKISVSKPGFQYMLHMYIIHAIHIYMYYIYYILTYHISLTHVYNATIENFHKKGLEILIAVVFCKECVLPVQL